MIDTHIHVVPPNLDGVGPLRGTLRLSADQVAHVVREEMDRAGITMACAIGAFPDHPEDPLGIRKSLEIAARVPGLCVLGAINPEWHDAESLQRAESYLKTGQVVGLKAYLGYVHRYPADAGYRPYYELAARYRIPVLFHTGDTYSPYAKLKYAHPIHIDEVAVDHPQTSFILAHVGNPWMIDAAEVVYKNLNVWVDLSGLVVGDELDISDPAQRAECEDVLTRIHQAFRYAERPNRFLYGSDWPLAPMTAYRDFVRHAIPADYHDVVFHENAVRLFRFTE